MFNAGKGHDFLAVELVNGHINYILNLGYGATILKDSCPGPLNDNKWHTVHIARYCLIRSINCRHKRHRLRLIFSRRPSKYKHNLLVDHHLSSANSRGDDIHLDLNGILFLGERLCAAAPAK